MGNILKHIKTILNNILQIYIVIHLKQIDQRNLFLIWKSANIDTLTLIQ